jgi:uncharacterized protein with FMN-binding domain
MRRAAVTLVATIVGLVLLLGFKSHGSGPTSRLVALNPTSPGSAQHRRTPPSTAPATSSHPNDHKSTRASAPSPSPAKPRSVTGQVVQTRYGPVQVGVTVTGHRITDVTPLQLPQGSGHDQQIDQEAVPQLRSEALAAQSAHIDIISGATYTSDGYAQSLQSALDQAGL